jgi:hypothetical protein
MPVGVGGILSRQALSDLETEISSFVMRPDIALPRNILLGTHSHSAPIEDVGHVQLDTVLAFVPDDDVVVDSRGQRTVRCDLLIGGVADLDGVVFP